MTNKGLVDSQCVFEWPIGGGGGRGGWACIGTLSFCYSSSPWLWGAWIGAPSMILLHGETMLDWLQPLKEVLNPQFSKDVYTRALSMWQHNAVRYGRGRINKYKWRRRVESFSKLFCSIYKCMSTIMPWMLFGPNSYSALSCDLRHIVGCSEDNICATGQPPPPGPPRSEN